MNKDENLTSALEARLGSEVGFVSVTKPQDYTRQYEFAAWSTKLRSDVGTFPIRLQLSPYTPYHPVLCASLPATIVWSYTQSHFGGVPIGDSPQGKDHPDARMKKRDAFGISIPYVKAACKGVGSVDHEVRWVLDEDVQAMTEEYLRACLRSARAWAARVDGIFDTIAAGAEIRPEDRYLLSREESSRLSSIGYAHERVTEYARYLVDLDGEVRFGARKSYPQNYDRAHADKYIEGLCRKCYHPYLVQFGSAHAKDCPEHAVSKVEVRP